MTEREKVCEWRFHKAESNVYKDVYAHWSTDCGEFYRHCYETQPKNFKCCPYCGKPIRVIEEEKDG